MMSPLKRTLILSTLSISILTLPLAARERKDEVERLNSAATILREVMETPDRGIPQELLASAKCVAVVPSLLKGGFVLGGQYGKGVATCKVDENSASRMADKDMKPAEKSADKGADKSADKKDAKPQTMEIAGQRWSAPTFFRVEGGSVGFQIGGQAVDLVMLVMNDEGMHNLLQSKFKLGADASVAAGPVGRYAEGLTDWKMRAQVLTYSRARGVFAGIALNGASIRQDKDATREFYGRMVPVATLLDGRTKPPSDADEFLRTVKHYATWVEGQKDGTTTASDQPKP